MRFQSPARKIWIEEAKLNVRNILVVLGKKQKRVLIIAAGSQVTISGLDILLLSLIGPFIASAGTVKTRDGELKSFGLWTISPQMTVFLILACIIVKAILGSVIQYWTLNNLARRETEITSAIIQSLMFEKIALGNRIKSPELVQLCTSVVNQIFGGIFRPLVSFIADFTTLVAIVIGLLILSPGVAFFLIFYCFALGAIFGLVYANKQKFIGIQTLEYGKNFLQTFFEILRMHKEIWLAHREDAILNTLNDRKSRYSKSIALGAWLQSQPRYFLEFSLVLGLCGVLILLEVVEKTSSIIPILALMCAAAYRVLPSLNSVIVSTGNFRSSVPSLKRLMEFREILGIKTNEIQFSLPTRRGERIPFKGDLIFRNVSFAYPNSGLEVISNFSHSFEENTTTILKGPSGVGKTTLLNLIIGLLTPQAGQIKFGSENELRSMNPLVSGVAYLSQEVPLLDGSFGYNVALREIGIEDMYALRQACKEAAILDRILRESQGFYAPVGENGSYLSAGERQRIGIARSLFSSSRLLVLDEPTANLDSESEMQIWMVLEKLKGSLTIIIISHKAAPPELYDQVIEF